MDYVFDMEADWIGWYRLKNGMLLHCDEYEGSGLWEDDWVGCDPVPDGAVCYTIYHRGDKGMEEYDGGIMGYQFGEPFFLFEGFLEEISSNYVIVERVEEPDWY